jgi:hypothetical protein
MVAVRNVYWPAADAPRWTRSRFARGAFAACEAVDHTPEARRWFGEHPWAGEATHTDRDASDLDLLARIVSERRPT